MKSVIMIILVGVLGVTLSAVATADSGWYLGGSYTQLDFSAGSEDLDFSTIGAQIGYNLSSSFAIELRGAKGQADDKKAALGIAQLQEKAREFDISTSQDANQFQASTAVDLTKIEVDSGQDIPGSAI